LRARGWAAQTKPAAAAPAAGFLFGQQADKQDARHKAGHPDSRLHLSDKRARAANTAAGA